MKGRARRCALGVVLSLTCAGCGTADTPVTNACPPAQPPASFGRACTADGECDGYLVCAPTGCAYPEAMTGQTSTGTASVALTHAGSTRAIYTVELARSDLQRQRGLALRPCIQPGWGMLFVHPDEAELEYTVADMKFAIDLVFADHSGRVVSVHPDLQPGEAGLVDSGAPAQYALELPAGALARLPSPPDSLVLR